MIFVLFSFVFLSGFPLDRAGVLETVDLGMINARASASESDTFVQAHVTGTHTSRSCRRCRTPSVPLGVLFLVYGLENDVFKNFADQAAVAAHRMKSLSPTLPIAIATSSAQENFDSIFDHVLMIREDHQFAGSNYQNRSDGYRRQWLTRILYLAETPFKITLAFDTNIIACRALLPALELLSQADFDIAVASVSPGSNAASKTPGWSHNFAIAYKWSARTSGFLDTWFLEQLDKGVAFDDQSTLVKAVYKFQSLYGHLKFKVLNPVLACAFTSSNPSAGFYPRETRVVEGEVFAVHGNPFRPDQECSNLNQTVSRRQIIFNGTVATSAQSASECSALISRPCRYAPLWRQSGAELVPSTQDLLKL